MIFSIYPPEQVFPSQTRALYCGAGFPGFFHGVQ